MADDISQQLRREIRQRADKRCEYCHTPEEMLLAACEVDHVISRKHGGITDPSNLALCCARCNRAKGTDVGSIHPKSGEFIRLFNPRKDHWSEHFKIDGPKIVGLTIIGQITATLLQLNRPERILERIFLQRAAIKFD